MQELALGIQDYPKLMKGDFVYVDKTELIYRLARAGFCYFLSRPRRFGKSLLVSTLASLFRGEKELFKSLWISESDYDWKPHPVVSLDFSRLASDSPKELLKSLNRYLGDVARQLGLSLQPRQRPSETLSLMVEMLRDRGEVVLLVDEYDSPLVKRLDDVELTRGNREVLLDFFSTVKSLQADLRFVFVTGVSRFSKVSLFSGMNSLIDISFDPSYATVTGLTEDEVAQYFGEHLLAVADQRGQAPEEVLELLHHWYDGYRFANEGERVFNPWSLLNFLSLGQLKNYWFSSGTPSFAIDLIKRQDWPLVDFDSDILAGSEIEADHNPDQIQLAPLLYQTGYLTLDWYEEATSTYHLRIPNEEVKQSLVEHLLVSYTQKQGSELKSTLKQMGDQLIEANLDSFFSIFNRLLATIPYPMHVAREGYYHSLLYLCVRAVGISTEAEVSTSRGRIDLVVSLDNRIYVFEFKIDLCAQEALRQIQDRDYAKQFEDEEKQVVLVGANFSSKTRQVDDWASLTQVGSLDDAPAQAVLGARIGADAREVPAAKVDDLPIR